MKRRCELQLLPGCRGVHAEIGELAAEGAIEALGVQQPDCRSAENPGIELPAPNDLRIHEALVDIHQGRWRMRRRCPDSERVERHVETKEHQCQRSRGDRKVQRKTTPRSLSFV